MREFRLFESLGQGSPGEAAEVFRGFMRSAVRELICRVMAEEVAELCGPRHHPSGGEAYRAGSSPGRVHIGGEREEVVRPRVRRRKAGGRSEEVGLETYTAAADPSELEASIMAALKAGVSTREVRDVVPEAIGTGRSSVSRLWQQVGHEFVEELRGRDLGQTDWVVLLLDGICLAPDQTAIVAVGIDREGRKRVLDFELGSSESKEICRDLLRRLARRGFRVNRRLFAVLDGSDALRSAVVEIFPDAVIQRCLVHKERNIKSKLSKRHWGELARLFKRLRQVQGAEAAAEVVDEIGRFLKAKNADAHASLLEAGGELTALHRLNVSNTLHLNLLSTNAIENAFRNTRRKMRRVTRFRPETDQASRWLAFSLLDAEKGFRRITGYTDIESLVAALERPPTGAQSPPGFGSEAFAYGSAFGTETRNLSTES